MQPPPEKLGSFYLGAEYDLDTSQRTEEIVNYDARDLTTHAVCVGMTGSGKTGLCIGLLEEAALDKVPAILIDPKGDITNLLLQFPDLQADDFQPWINPDDARRKGKSVDEFAQETADLWRNGLADWGITAERIRTLQATTDYTVFTPGSEAGVPISILGSLAAPGLDFATYGEEIRERISGTVAALLGLVGVKADPIRSRESILLANIFEHFWQLGQDLDLAKLITSIQNPPVRQIGVFDVDTFYPADDRFELAMSFNNLMAAPTFQAWLKGESLNIESLFLTAESKPRHSIFYIAHLSDNERMFFVTLLLENLLTWMRRQTGTTSLRALLYFDEIFGFFPPTAEPPSKRPLLTLLKQARAFGLGTILVTQNPVDIDYKGLTNAGTWFIGKLQAERDKMRVLEGLQGAIAEAGGQRDIDFDTLISRLGNRVFLLHNVHDDGPIVFHTRWAQSYLRGPLTRPQVTQLMAGRKQVAAASQPRRVTQQEVAATPVAPSAPAATATAAPAAPAGFSTAAPALDPALIQVFLPIEVSEAAALREIASDASGRVEPEAVQLLYEPAIIAAARVRYLDRKRNIDQQKPYMLLARPPEQVGSVEWEGAERLSLEPRDLLRAAEQPGADRGPFYAATPDRANDPGELKNIERDFADWLYYNSSLTVNTHAALGLHQEPDENERTFKMRLQQAARERRDDEVDKLERSFKSQFERLEARLRKETRELAEDQAQHEARKREEWVSLGETVLGVILGRRRTTALSKAATKRRMTSQAHEDIAESEEEIAEIKESIAAMEADLKAQADEITLKWANILDEVSSEEVKPRRTDVNVELVALAWLPSWHIRYQDSRGTREATVAAYALPN